MDQFEQHEITIRYLKVVDDLVKRKIVANQSEFCKRIGYGVQSFSQIRVGKRNVTIDLIDKLFREFRGNPMFLLTGSGNTILSDNALTIVQDPESVYAKVDEKGPSLATLQELVKSKDQIIELLRKEVSRLESENKQKKQKN